MKIYEQFRTISELHAHLKAQGITNSKDETAKWARANIPKESYFQNLILKYLRALTKTGKLRGYVWKVAAGLYQVSGLPDICLIADGRYFGFEVKRPLIGEPRLLQLKTAEHLREVGGVVEFVSYVSEVEAILRGHGVLEGGGAGDDQ